MSASGRHLISTVPSSDWRGQAGSAVMRPEDLNLAGSLTGGQVRKGLPVRGAINRKSYLSERVTQG